MENYLKATPLIDWEKPAVLQKTFDLIAGLESEIDKAKCLYEWVRDSIPHSKDMNASVVTRKASEVLSEGTGICYAKTILLAAMLRSVKIPTGFCYQVLRPDLSSQNTLVHALNGIYLSSMNQWIRVDSRGNTGSFNGQFGVETEKLVFPEDSSESIIIYDKIFADPARVVVDALMKFNDVNELLQNLPEEIQGEN